MGKTPNLDAIDLALIRRLQDDARQTNRELASAVGVSTSTSSERVRSLRDRGVIRGYHADVDLQELGRGVQALISVRIRPPSRDNVEGFRDWAAQLPEVVGLFVVSGRDDFLLHVAVGDTDGLYGFVLDRLTERSEVADVQTAVVYEHIRRSLVDVLGS